MNRCSSCVNATLASNDMYVCKYQNPGGVYGFECCSHYRATAEKIEVIRCKDCDWYGIVELKKDGTVDMRYKPSWCFLWRAPMNAGDYCSVAVRRIEDE